MIESNLTVQIDSAGMQKIISNNEKIVITRSFDDSTEHVVVCAVLEPFKTINVIFYPEIRGFAAVIDQIIDFQIVFKSITSDNPIQSGKICTFQDNWFYPWEQGGIPNTYGIKNQQETKDNEDNKGNINFGLAQKISVNNNEFLAALNIYPVPYNQTIYFQPLEKIKIFLATNIETEMIIPSQLLQPITTLSDKIRSPIIVGKYLELDLSTKCSIRFNNDTNAFEQVYP